MDYRKHKITAVQVMFALQAAVEEEEINAEDLPALVERFSYAFGFTDAQRTEFVSAMED